MARCFSCKIAEAGFSGSPHSAYCVACQPSPRSHRRGAECECGGCHQVFTSVTAFDQHRRGFACREPAQAGLVVARERPEGLVWGMPGGRPQDVFRARHGGPQGASA